MSADSHISRAERKSYEARYCSGNTPDCARYLVNAALGMNRVPDDLLPDDRVSALRLVRPSHVWRPEQRAPRGSG